MGVLYSEGFAYFCGELKKILYKSLGMLKSKNLLKNTNGTTTQNGITFTRNSDGSVTCNGTATADATYICIVTLPQNTSLILSGCPTGGSNSTYCIFVRDTDTWSVVYFDTGSGKTVKTGIHTTWQVVIRISNGQTVNNMTFYPMIRNADIYADDAEYEPYNDDLQTQINELRMQVAALTGAANSSISTLETSSMDEAESMDTLESSDLQGGETQ